MIESVVVVGMSSLTPRSFGTFGWLVGRMDGWMDHWMDVWKENKFLLGSCIPANERTNEFRILLSGRQQLRPLTARARSRSSQDEQEIQDDEEAGGGGEGDGGEGGGGGKFLTFLSYLAL